MLGVVEGIDAAAAAECQPSPARIHPAPFAARACSAVATLSARRARTALSARRAVATLSARRARSAPTGAAAEQLAGIEHDRTAPRKEGRTNHRPRPPAHPAQVSRPLRACRAWAKGPPAGAEHNAQ